MNKSPSYDELLERVKALQELANKNKLLESESDNDDALYKLLFEKMLDEVHIWEVVRNSEGEIYTWRLVNANPAALKTWGKSLDEIKGKTTDEIFPGGDAARIFMPLVKKIFHEQKPHIWEQFFPSTNQTLYMISIPDGDRFISCGIDVKRIRETENELLRVSRELNKSLMDTIASIARSLEYKDAYTGGHQKNVAVLSDKIATKLGLGPTRIDGVRLGASIQDVGNISIPAEILNKPGPLGSNEFELVKNHVQIGADIVSGIKFPWPIKEIISQHHERLNGSGYPKGLKGEQILLEARIVAVADVFCAMTSHRPYRASLGQLAALEELIKNKDVLYDGKVVEALVTVIEKGEAPL